MGLFVCRIRVGNQTMLCPGVDTGICSGSICIRIVGSIDKIALCGQGHITIPALNPPDTHIAVILGKENITCSGCGKACIRGIIAYGFRTGLHHKRFAFRADGSVLTGKVYTLSLHRGAGRRAVHHVSVSGNLYRTQRLIALSLYNAEAALIGIKGNIAIHSRKRNRSGIACGQRRMQHVNIICRVDIRMIA